MAERIKEMHCPPMVAIVKFLKPIVPGFKRKIVFNGLSKVNAKL
jgi:hypothetical protein